MPNMTQEQLRARMRRLDDVFHRMIVSLERLEIFLEAIRLDGKANKELSSTAINTNRDGHDDKSNPPSRDSFYGEVQLDCSALYFQTSFDDREVFESSVKYFLNDLLEWYGGRNDAIPYNGVDAFVLPIIVSLSQQVNSVADIMDVVEKYVAKIPNMSSFPDEVKADAISDGMSKLILMMENEHHKDNENDKGDEEVIFTQHKRGEAVDGYKRLIMAMLSLYDEAMPAIVVFRTVSNYLPEVVSMVPSITELSITHHIDDKVSSAPISETVESNIDERKSENTEEPNRPECEADIISGEMIQDRSDDKEAPFQKLSISSEQDDADELDNHDTADENSLDISQEDSISSDLKTNDVPFQQKKNESDGNIVVEGDSDNSLDEKDVEQEEHNCSLVQKIKKIFN